MFTSLKTYYQVNVNKFLAKLLYPKATITVNQKKIVCFYKIKWF